MVDTTYVCAWLMRICACNLMRICAISCLMRICACKLGKKQNNTKHAILLRNIVLLNGCQSHLIVHYFFKVLHVLYCSAFYLACKHLASTYSHQTADSTYAHQIESTYAHQHTYVVCTYAHTHTNTHPRTHLHSHINIRHRCLQYIY